MNEWSLLGALQPGIACCAAKRGASAIQAAASQSSLKTLTCSIDILTTLGPSRLWLPLL